MYFSLRLTVEYLPLDSSASVIFSKLISNYKLSIFGSCFEHKNKYLESCRPHWHFSFISDEKKETIQHYLNVKFGLKGNEMYALSSYRDVNPARFWRYLMKESDLVLSSLPLSDLNYSIAELTMLSREERLHASLYWIQKRERLQKKFSLFEKLMIYLDKNKKLQAYCSGQFVFSSIVEYYIKNDLNINPRTISGYTDLYLLKKRIISVSDYTETHYSG